MKAADNITDIFPDKVPASHFLEMLSCKYVTILNINCLNLGFLLTLLQMSYLKEVLC